MFDRSVAAVGALVCPDCHHTIPPARADEPAWFFVRDQHKVGPLSRGELQSLAERGELKPDDNVWPPGASSGVLAASISGLFPKAEPDQTSPLLVTETADHSPDGLEGEEPTVADGPLSCKGIRVRPHLTLTLGDFQIIKKLGSGGMGAVYLAQQRSQNRPVALKLLSEHLAGQQAFIARFYREAEVLATLDHPNIVRFCGVGEENGMPFFAMEFIEGISTAAVLKHQGRLQIGDALYIVRCCADALRYAHSHQIVHRDIKPENIMLTRLGQVKIADLGLAKAMDEDVTLTDTGTGLGTPKYMAPEQAKNAKHADARSDIYALGAVLYHFVTGQAPFQGTTGMELMLAKEQGFFTPARRLNADASARLGLIIDKMLAKSPKYRYQNCESLIRDLDKLGEVSAHLSFNPVYLSSQRKGNRQFDLVEILLVHDDLKDILLAQQALEEQGIPSNLNIVEDGAEAVAFLRQQGKYSTVPQPSLIILGRDLRSPISLELLELMRSTPRFRRIPLVVLANAGDTEQFLEDHGFHTSLTVSRPHDLDQFDRLIRSVQGMCLTVVERPPRTETAERVGAGAVREGTE
jgi:serine/threonine protein kinase